MRRAVASSRRTSGRVGGRRSSGGLRAPFQGGTWPPGSRIRWPPSTPSRRQPAAQTAARQPISRGLRQAAAGQSELGLIEAWAHAAVHGSALAEIGARIAVTAGRPRELLSRIEATRLMSSRMPSLRPPADPELAQLLAELRSVAAALTDPATTDDQRHTAERDGARLELAVRRRTRATRWRRGRDGWIPARARHGARPPR